MLTHSAYDCAEKLARAGCNATCMLLERMPQLVYSVHISSIFKAVLTELQSQLS